MTNKQIKEALIECNHSTPHCRKCPYFNKVHFCRDTFINDTLELISVQEKEMVWLRNSNRDFIAICEYYKHKSDQLEKQVDKLKTEVKQAKIDVLIELKKKYGFYTCCSWGRATKLLGEIIDEFIEDIKNEQDTSNDTARGGDRSMAKK